jgi:uncharacterized membrane protein (UPF0182 family)
LLNLLRQGSTRVLNGNLLTLPVGGGLLFVQPVYVESTGETSYPLLQKILVAFGDKIAFEDTLEEALDALFGGDSGAVTGDSDVVDPDAEGAEGTEDSGSADRPAADSGNPALDVALQAARQALLDKEAALRAGNWEAFGEADQRLATAIEDALAALD